MLFAKFGFMISDEASIKSVCGNKGAAGTVLCLQCQNCIDHKADLTSHDASEMLVASTCTDMSRFRLHNAESVQATLDYLRAQQPLLGKGAFAKLEQSLGFNWQNETVMSHEAVGGRLAVATPMQACFLANCWLLVTPRRKLRISLMGSALLPGFVVPSRTGFWISARRLTL